MKILKPALVAAALIGGGFAASGASAAPAIDPGVAAPGLTQDVRIVCNEWGRCWRTRPRWRGYGVYGPPAWAPAYGYRNGPRWRHRHRNWR